METLTERRHDPDGECDGMPHGDIVIIGGGPVTFTRKCPECGVRLCSCEMAYGHDCEA